MALRTNAEKHSKFPSNNTYAHGGTHSLDTYGYERARSAHTQTHMQTVTLTHMYARVNWAARTIISIRFHNLNESGALDRHREAFTHFVILYRFVLSFSSCVFRTCSLVLVELDFPQSSIQMSVEAKWA